jgi:hypothetical protein
LLQKKKNKGNNNNSNNNNNNNNNNGGKEENNNEGNKEDNNNNNNNNTLILKVHMHCDACAAKITKYLDSIKGTKSDLGFHLLLLLINLFFQNLEIEQQCLCFKVLKR